MAGLEIRLGGMEGIAEGEHGLAGIGHGAFGVDEAAAIEAEILMADEDVVHLQLQAESVAEHTPAHAGTDGLKGFRVAGAVVAARIGNEVEIEGEMLGGTESVVEHEVQRGVVHLPAHIVGGGGEERLREVDAEHGAPPFQGRGQIDGGTQLLRVVEIAEGEDCHVGVFCRRCGCRRQSDCAAVGTSLGA